MAFLNNAGVERLWAHITTRLDKKVDKIEGKGLSTEDFTTEEKNKLAAIQEGAGASVQPDWNQNDESAPDYIKNRICYSEDAEFMNESALEFSDADFGLPAAMILYTQPMIVGETYTVVWDGEAYECTAEGLEDGFIALGNIGALDGSDTGEPFLVEIILSEGICLIADIDGMMNGVSTSVHDVSIVGKRYETINKAYIPTIDWNGSEGALPVANRPMYSDIIAEYEWDGDISGKETVKIYEYDTGKTINLCRIASTEGLSLNITDTAFEYCTQHLTNNTVSTSGQTIMLQDWKGYDNESLVHSSDSSVKCYFKFSGWSAEFGVTSEEGVYAAYETDSTGTITAYTSSITVHKVTKIGSHLLPHHAYLNSVNTQSMSLSSGKTGVTLTTNDSGDVLVKKVGEYLTNPPKLLTSKHIDTTLTVSGAAADALATGNKITAANNAAVAAQSTATMANSNATNASTAAANAQSAADSAALAAALAMPGSLKFDGSLDGRDYVVTEEDDGILAAYVRVSDEPLPDYVLEFTTELPPVVGMMAYGECSAARCEITDLGGMLAIGEAFISVSTPVSEGDMTLEPGIYTICYGMSNGDIFAPIMYGTGLSIFGYVFEDGSSSNYFEKVTDITNIGSTLEWDGTTDDRWSYTMQVNDTTSITLALVSTSFPTYEELANNVGNIKVTALLEDSLINSDSEDYPVKVALDTEDGAWDLSLGGTGSSTLFYYGIPYDNFNFDNLTLPKKGIYAIMSANQTGVTRGVSLTIPGHNFTMETEREVLKQEHLPEALQFGTKYALCGSAQIVDGALVWDGNTSGLDAFEVVGNANNVKWYKVYDSCIDAFQSGTDVSGSVTNSSGTFNTTLSVFFGSPDIGYVYAGGEAEILIFTTDEVAKAYETQMPAQFQGVLSKGIYFFKHDTDFLSHVSLDGHEFTSEIITKIDEKYLNLDYNLLENVPCKIVKETLHFMRTNLYQGLTSCAELHQFEKYDYLIATYGSHRYELYPFYKINFKVSGNYCEMIYYGNPSLALDLNDQPMQVGDDNGIPFCLKVYNAPSSDHTSIVFNSIEGIDQNKEGDIYGVEASYKRLREGYLPESVQSVIIRSSTPGSAKKFKLTIDDSGTIAATEITN